MKKIEMTRYSEKNEDMVHSQDEIGTLGENKRALTCSMAVAKNAGFTIKHYPTFESAIQDCKANKVPAVLVPGAYPGIGKFIMDQALKVGAVFLHPIPDLVLAGTRRLLQSHRKSVHAIIHHPATAPLLPETQVSYKKTILATSNSKACEMLLDKRSPALVITNQLCADFFGLKTITILRRGIIMPFIVFKKA